MKYQIDTLIKMLCLAGNYVSEDTSSNIINLILSVGDDLGVYSVHKLFLAGKNYSDQEALIKVSVYIIGEFGEKLVSCSAITSDNVSVNYSEIEVLNWLDSINEKKVCQEYILNALLKLSSKFRHVNTFSSIQSQIKSFNYEVQQRAVEYSIFKSIITDDIKQEIVKSVPLPKNLDINKKYKLITLEKFQERMKRKKFLRI
jgi:AP-1 complex subunit gamma-1